MIVFDYSGEHIDSTREDVCEPSAILYQAPPSGSFLESLSPAVLVAIPVGALFVLAAALAVRRYRSGSSSTSHIASYAGDRPAEMVVVAANPTYGSKV